MCYCALLLNINMKQIIPRILSVVFLASCHSQAIDENSVDLYQQYSADEGYSDFYEKDSKTPYTGQLISESKTDQVLINFKNGKMNGSFLRLNSNGDTLELRKYDFGTELYSISYKYDNGKMVERKKSKKENGDTQDFEIFTKSLNLIKTKQFSELDDYLNPLHSGYESTFLKLESLFGKLEKFEIKKISKEYYDYNKSEHLRAEIHLHFKEKSLEVGFLIVEKPNEISGQGFSFPSLGYELIKDDLIFKLINSLNNYDVDEIIKMTQFTEQHKEVLQKDFDKIGEISSAAEFLNCHFEFFNETLLMKDYLVTVGSEQQVLALTYKIDENNGIELMQFKFLPYRKPYSVMHKIN